MNGRAWLPLRKRQRSELANVEAYQRISEQANQEAPWTTPSRRSTGAYVQLHGDRHQNIPSAAQANPDRSSGKNNEHLANSKAAASSSPITDGRVKSDIPRDVNRKASMILGLSGDSYQQQHAIHNRVLDATDNDPFISSSIVERHGTQAARPTDESPVPLTASSSKTEILTIRIHGNNTKVLKYGHLIVIATLSHQTWVSGEVLYFKVEIDNMSRKFIKSIGLEFLRTISSSSHAEPPGNSAPASMEATSKPLAMWNWKRGVDGWSGVHPQTQMIRIWNPIVPEGQATTSERGIEVSYSLAVTVPSFWGKSASAWIPLKIIAPNSLGKLRLEQCLRHHCKPTHLQASSSSNPLIIPSEEVTMKFNYDADRRGQDNDTSQAKVQGRDSITNGKRSMEPNPLTPRHDSSGDSHTAAERANVFINSNPIPRASDELLSEMLSRLQSKQKPRKIAKTLRRGRRTKASDVNGRHQVSHKDTDPSQGEALKQLSVLQPLSTIRAHCRRKSSDDVNHCDRRSENLDVQCARVERASFDDFLRTKTRQSIIDKPKLSSKGGLPGNIRRSSTSTPEPPLSLLDDSESIVEEGEESEDRETSSDDSPHSTDSHDLSHFLEKRQNFYTSRCSSSNPFFKGLVCKERLRCNRDVAYRKRSSLQGKSRKAGQPEASQLYSNRRERRPKDDEAPSGLKLHGDFQGLAENQRHTNYNLPTKPSKKGESAAWKYSGQRTLF